MLKPPLSIYSSRGKIAVLSPTSCSLRTESMHDAPRESKYVYLVNCEWNEPAFLSIVREACFEKSDFERIHCSAN